MSIIICCNSRQHTAPQVKIYAVLQYSSWCRDGNSSNATHLNAYAAEYEQSFSVYYGKGDKYTIAESNY